MHHAFETYLPWFILREIPFVGNTVYKRLIGHLGSAADVLAASKQQLQSIHGVGPKIVNGILNHTDYAGAAQKELEAVLKHQYKIVTLTDPRYPPLLSEIPDPPPILTYLGHLDNQSPCLSIVGSRKATVYGLNTAKDLSSRLSRTGFQIVSGLARGIDAMAHKGALNANKKTIAVLGSGLNKIYPRENKRLFDAIASTGTVFSEFKIDSDPIAANFPVRNRIIAGLSCGTLVVEAAKKSGSLITARLAGEYNREVFAVPGSIASSRSQGTHSLLKQGAKLVEDELDIVDELGQFVHVSGPGRPDEKRMSENKNNPCKEKTSHIFDFLEPYPVHIDSLIKRSRMESSTVAAQLIDLELSGRVLRHPGNYYSISEEYH